MVARPTRKKMYRTMQGRMVDIEKLRAANESVQAVGNMNVNARGDVLGPGGTIVTPKETVIKKYYEQPKGVVSDTPTRSKHTTAPKAETKQPIQKITPITKTAVKKQPEAKTESEPTTVETFKPTTEIKEKRGIDEALDGLE